MTKPATTHATCKFCGLLMNGPACTITTYEIGGQTFDRIPFKGFDWATEIVDCNDCNIHVGDLHHPRCDIEECPRCHQQAIACCCNPDLRLIG